MPLRYALLAFLFTTALTPARGQTVAPGSPTVSDGPGAPATSAAEVLQPASPPVATMTADESGFKLQSADNAFSLRIRGDAQTDGRFFVDDPGALGTDQILLRRARINLQGTLGGRYDFRIMPNFGQGRFEIQDVYVNARFTPAFAVQAGKFKVPFGLEWLRSANDLSLVELGLPSALVPRRDVGVMVHGDVAGGRVGYEVALFNGALDGQNADGDAGDGKDVAGRLFFQPFRSAENALKGLGFGFAATYGEETGAFAAPAVASYRATGGRTIARFRTGTADSTTVLADGERFRYSPQAHLYVGPASLLGEYVVSTQAVRLNAATAELTATAWQVIGGYVLTGERASYGRLRPARPLGTRGGFGAFEVTARFGALSFDEDAFPTFTSPTTSTQRAQAWAAGLSWYPTANVRVMANYERTTFELSDAAPEGTPALPAEGLVFTRFQVAF